MSIKTRFVAFLGWLILQFISKTSRIQFIENDRYKQIIDSKKPCIYAFWHGRQLFVVYWLRHRRIVVMVSRSKDGDYMANLLHNFGFETVRGSTEHGTKSRGGARAMIEMIKKIRQGYSSIFTPDGPVGPLKKVQLGVIITAQKTGVPIIPLACAAKKKKVVTKNWDQYFIFYPFNRIVAMYGEPVYVKPEDNPEQKAIELETLINEITDKSDRIVNS